jgi:hypothetical protein
MKPVLSALVFLLGLLCLCSTAHADDTKTIITLAVQSKDAQVSMRSLTPNVPITITVIARAPLSTGASVECMLIDDKTNILLVSLTGKGSCVFNYTPSQRGWYGFIVKNLGKDPIFVMTTWE